MIMLILNGCTKKEDPIQDPIISSGKQIIFFKIVTPATTGVIDTTAKTITVLVPVGTALTNLNTDISLATGYTVSPASGVSKDFTNPVVYTVTRGTTTTNWTVTVKILYPVLSPGKQMIYFKFVTPAVTGIIDTTLKTITLPVAAGTVVTSLVTDISIAPGYTITPATGVAKDFTNPVTYTVSRTGQTSVVWTVSASLPVTNVTADITSSVTWTANKTYFVTGDININNNAVLTIEAGTVIKFNSGASLSVGYNTTGTVLANGTANSPIIFTSTAVSPTAGAWVGLRFYTNTSNTSLTYCNILFAGSSSNYGAVYLYSCDIAMNNCTISNSSSYGIKTYYANSKGGFVTFSNNTISSTANYGIVIHAQKLSSIGTGNTFSNVIGTFIEGDFNNNTAQTWRKLSVPYIIDHGMDIDGNLTIEAGATFKFTANGVLYIGYNSTTTFVADGGTSGTPITFTSNATSPTAGAWRGIAFYGYAQINSKMNYCIIDYAGSNVSYGALEMSNNSSIIFTNNIIRNSGSFGINMYIDAGFQSFTNNTINTCANHLIVISTKHLPELGTGNALIAATGKGILISGGASYNTAVTWKKQTADFYVAGGALDMDGDITIEAGSKFLFINDTYFYFGYNASTKITAVGTSANKITFTSAASSPAAGSWKGLYFYQYYTQTNSALTYCAIQYTGLQSKPAIYTEVSFPINNTTIDNSSIANPAQYKTGITVPPGTGNNFSWVAN